MNIIVSSLYRSNDVITFMNTIFKKPLYFFLISNALVSMSCSQVTETSTDSVSSPELPTSFSKISSNRLPTAPSQEVVDAAKELTKKDKHGYKTYPDSIRRRLVRTTSYSHMENEKGAVGRKNCQGGILKYGSVRSAASDWSVYPVGTKFRVKGLSEIFIIDDFGSALVGTNTIDIYHQHSTK